MSGVGAARPFKLWNWDRTLKKSVTAATLKDVVAKGREKLGMSDTEPVNVVLEEDGTEIEEEDYFVFLPFNTTLMILRAGDKWGLPGTEAGTDEPDYMAANSSLSDRTRQLVISLHKDITKLIAFSNEDLQQIVDINVDDLAHLICDTPSYATALQDGCQRVLDERQETAEAMSLLKIYHNARTHSRYVDEEPPKRKSKLS